MLTEEQRHQIHALTVAPIGQHVAGVIVREELSQRPRALRAGQPPRGPGCVLNPPALDQRWLLHLRPAADLLFHERPGHGPEWAGTGVDALGQVVEGERWIGQQPAVDAALILGIDQESMEEAFEAAPRLLLGWLG